MEKRVEGNLIAYKAEDDTVYAITPLTGIAGVLVVSQIPANPKKDLDYIFADSGASKLILFVPAGAEDEKKVARSAGFKQEGRLKKAAPDGDLLVFGQYR